ncbi:MAG: flagellin [Candidatus Latescibacterota bacterium]|nr:flagellin [Candidatus Latescibacterota bacterium]
MPLRINHNIAAINARRRMNTNFRDQGIRLERLSSGLRINRAADDAAGLSVREGMRAEISGLRQNVLNAEQGNNLLQVAEGSLNEINAMLIRMRELAIQSASSTVNDLNRESIQAEYNQIIQEIDRVSWSTTYNDQVLLTGFGNTVTQNSLISTALDGFSGVKVISISGAVAGTYTFTDTSDTDNQINLEITLDDGTKLEQSIDIGPSLDLDNGKNLVATGTTFVANFDRLGVQLNLVGAGVDDHQTPTWKLSEPPEEDGAINLVTHDEAACDPQCVEIEAGEDLEDIQVKLDAALKELDPEAFARIDDITGELQVDVKDIETDGFQAAGFVGANVYEDGRLEGKVFRIMPGDGGGSFQVGPYDGPNNRIEVAIDDMRATGPRLNLKPTSVATINTSRTAITQIDHAIERVSRQRGDLGAWMNRLNFTISFTENSIENVQNSEASISDADIATEISRFTRAQVLSQAATSMLAQANIVPQTVLQLLQ